MLLIYAKTDTKWWHRFIEDRAEVHFIKGRIEFIKPNSLKRNAAPYPSCWVIYRKNTIRNEKLTKPNELSGCVP